MLGARKKGQVSEGGQSTVEFMLMIPLIFAMLFFVIEMGLYFSAVHYANYATYVTARCRQVGYGASGLEANQQSSENEVSIAAKVLTGSVFFDNYVVTDSSQKGVTVQMLSWKTNFPFLRSLLPDMPFSTSVNLGTNEMVYERNAAGLRAQQGYDANCTDNDINWGDNDGC